MGDATEALAAALHRENMACSEEWYATHPMSLRDDMERHTEFAAALRAALDGEKE